MKEYSVNDAGAIETAENYIMPFGKYRGKRLGDIPNGHIRWMAENFNSDGFIINETIASFADLIRRYREKWNIKIEEK